MRHPQPKTLPWSWERSHGWRGQWDRIHRWRDRIHAIIGTNRLEDIFDFLLAFFVAAYHLRDWLLRSNPEMKSNLDTLFTQSDSLRLCADIANVAKHFELTNPPRAPAQFSFAREYIGKNRGWFGKDGRLLLLTPSHQEDVLDLVEACIKDWTGFLNKHGLIAYHEDVGPTSS